MTRRIIASFAAIATLFVVGITSTSAQTAGTSTLEQIGYLVKGNYAFNMNAEGSVLGLSDYSTGDQVMTISTAGSNEVVLHTVLGNLATLSKSRQTDFRQALLFMNTRLPVGTITVEKSGIVRMQHRVNVSLVPIVRISHLINRFSNEAALRRAQIFA